VTADYLAGKGSPSPRLDAELLLAEALGLARIDLYTQPERPVEAAELAAYRELVARRARHEPVAYLLGRASFRYLQLGVSPAVLIPRPETEELVQHVLDWLRERPLLEAGRPRTAPGPGAPSPGPAAEPPPESEASSPRPAAEPAPPAIADVGTGSGAIALSLASEAGVRVVGIDRSPEALAVADRNREALGLEDLVGLRSGDLLEGLTDGSLRVVVGNPPYVSAAELAGLAPDVRLFEPAAALLGGPDGLDAFRRLVPQAAAALGPGGALFLEVGETQAAAVAALGRGAGFALVATERDLSGKERVVRMVRPGALVLDPLDLAPEGAASLGAALREGALLGVPTDTVYGLAAAWDSARGVRRLFAAKGRGQEAPVAVLFASVEAVRAALPDLDPEAAWVLRGLLPGPYTFVVGTGVPRPPLVGTSDSLGVRVPDHGPLLGLLAALGVPLAASSANLSGAPAPAGLEQVDPLLLAWCTAAFGTEQADRSADPRPEAAPGTASTVVDLRPLAQGAEAVVLREGPVPAEEVRESVRRLVRAGQAAP